MLKNAPGEIGNDRPKWSEGANEDGEVGAGASAADEDEGVCVEGVSDFVSDDSAEGGADDDGVFKQSA